MSIESCLEDAQKKFKEGAVETVRISFVTCRTNELMAGKAMEYRREAMKQANKEADEQKTLIFTISATPAG